MICHSHHLFPIALNKHSYYYYQKNGETTINVEIKRWYSAAVNNHFILSIIFWVYFVLILNYTATATFLSIKCCSIIADKLSLVLQKVPWHYTNHSIHTPMNNILKASLMWKPFPRYVECNFKYIPGCCINCPWLQILLAALLCIKTANCLLILPL